MPPLSQTANNLAVGSAASTTNVLAVGEAAANELRDAEGKALLFATEEQKRKLATSLISKAGSNAVSNAQSLIQSA